jgi:hypothetical protein
MDIDSLVNPLTPDQIAVVLTLHDSESEPILFNRLQQIAATWELGYAEVGLICREVDAYLLWQQRPDPDTGEPCASFARWIHVCCPRSYSTVYAAMRDVEALKDVPDRHLAKIPASNFPIVKQLSTAVRNDPEVMAGAQTKCTEDFVEQIRRDHPGQAIERSRVLRFKLDESAADEVEAVIQMAEARGAKNWAEALEAICAEVKTQWLMESDIMDALETENQP